jgi:CRISPR/Cas system-associated exonuclease Cas4 (RecB family)
MKDGDVDSLEEDVEEFLATITDPEIDKSVINSLWYNMAKTLMDNAVTDSTREIVGTEDFMFRKLNNDVYVGGTYDALIKDKADYSGTGLCVVDYKTASSKPSGINWKYKLQAYTYAWMLTESGKNITAIELCFVTRPTKTLPVRYFPFKEPYTEQNHEFIGSILRLIAESVTSFKNNPELRHLLSQDMRLKAGPAPVAFPGSLH